MGRDQAVNTPVFRNGRRKAARTYSGRDTVWHIYEQRPEGFTGSRREACSVNLLRIHIKGCRMMKKRGWILAALIAALHTTTTLSSFHGPDWLTCVLMVLWITAILALAVNLLVCQGQWTFRMLALTITAAYATWLGWEFWQFMTHAD